MSAVDLIPLAVGERRDLADFLETLTPEQWRAQSLCAEWTVHQVVAHLISYEELGPLALVARFAKGRLGVNGVNAVGVREYADRSPEELLVLLREHLTPRGLTAGFGGGIALTDGLIHHQDIRRPLGAPRDIPPERLLAALRIAERAPTLPSRRKVRGLRLVAADLDWSTGTGPEVAGPAEAILMAIAGRPAAISDLHGPGVDILAGRIPAVRVQARSTGE